MVKSKALRAVTTQLDGDDDINNDEDGALNINNVDYWEEREEENDFEEFYLQNSILVPCPWDVREKTLPSHPRMFQTTTTSSASKDSIFHWLLVTHTYQGQAV